MSLLPVAEALARLLSGVEPLEPEEVPLDRAAGRVLAASLTALRTQPPFSASAMDGYAVRAGDVAEVPAILRLAGEVAAGQEYGGNLGPGECIRIFTGAPMPRGADAVLIQENAERLADGRVRALAPVTAGRHVRPAGQDFVQGQELLPAGRVLDAAALALAAAANHARLPVIRRPRIAILATGDELVPPGSLPGPGQIVASNSFGIAAIVAGAGGEAIDLGIARDDRQAIAAAIRSGLDDGADAIVTIGGASVGDHDLVGEVLEEVGFARTFHKVAMRPGKPVMSGRMGSRHLLGLPGNPVSAMIAAWIFLEPLVALLGGRPEPARLRTGRLAAAMPANGDRQDYVRARITLNRDGLVATPFDRQDSSLIRVLAEADGLVVRPPHAPAAMPGESCDILLLRPAPSPTP